MLNSRNAVDVGLLKLICDTPGVSGFEEPVRAVLAAEFERTCDEVRIDRMGNLIGLKRASRQTSTNLPLKVMVSAHMDEIGLAVRHIDPAGFVRIMPIGGIDPRTLMSERIIIHGRKDVRGFIAPPPGWILAEEEKKRVLPVKELIVDTGLSKLDIDKLVTLGDPISFAAGFQDLNGEMVMGRNFDDRVGVYTLVEALRRIGPLAIDLYAVASVQEEVGVRGAITAAYAIDPDIGIAIDGSLASDVPYARDDEQHCVLGKGTGIYLIDNRTISDPSLVRFLVSIAEGNNIQFQRNLGGGTDASEIQRTRSGTRALTIGAPTRYMHSTTQLCHKGDIEHTVRLLVAFLESADMGVLR